MARAALVLLCLAVAASAYKPVVRTEPPALSFRSSDLAQLCMHGFSYDAESGTYHDYDNIAQWYGSLSRWYSPTHP